MGKLWIFIMKRIIRLTENDLHSLIADAVRRVVSEGAFDKYAKYNDGKDLGNILLNSVYDGDSGMAYAYAHMNDPMVKRVRSNTLSGLTSDSGTPKDSSSESYEDASQDFIINQFLNTPNAARDFKTFPRYSRKDGGLKNYDSLRNGSERINAYKRRKGAI